MWLHQQCTSVRVKWFACRDWALRCKHLESTEVQKDYSDGKMSDWLHRSEVILNQIQMHSGLTCHCLVCSVHTKGLSGATQQGAGQGLPCRHEVSINKCLNELCWWESWFKWPLGRESSKHEWRGPLIMTSDLWLTIIKVKSQWYL